MHDGRAFEWADVQFWKVKEQIGAKRQINLEKRGSTSDKRMKRFTHQTKEEVQTNRLERVQQRIENEKKKYVRERNLTISERAFNLMQNFGKHKQEEDKYEWEIDFKELKFHSNIGSGNFGEVFKGSWCGTEVAVKLPHLGISEELMDKFITEVALMTTLHHPNIGTSYYRSENYK